MRLVFVWDERTGTCRTVEVHEPLDAYPEVKPVPAGYWLPEFVPTKDRSKTAVALDRLRSAVSQILASSEAYNYRLLCSNPDYAARHDRGCEKGLAEGTQTALERWYREYVELAELIWEVFVEVCGQTRTLSEHLGAAADFSADISAFLHDVYVNKRDPVQLGREPRYAAVNTALNFSIATIVIGSNVYSKGRSVADTLADPDYQKLKAFLATDPNLDELKRCLQTWDVVARVIQRVVRKLISIDLFKIPGKILGFLDEATAETVDTLREYTDEIFSTDIALLNGQPDTQGYFIGWTLGEGSVNTVRYVIEEQYLFILLEPAIANLLASLGPEPPR